MQLSFSSGFVVVVIVLRVIYSLLIDTAIFGESRKASAKRVEIIFTFSCLTRGVVDSSSVHIVVFSRVGIPLILWIIFPFMLFLVFNAVLTIKIPVPFDRFKPGRVRVLNDAPLAVSLFTRFFLVVVIPNAGLFYRLVPSASLIQTTQTHPMQTSSLAFWAPFDLANRNLISEYWKIRHGAKAHQSAYLFISGVLLTFAIWIVSAVRNCCWR